MGKLTILSLSLALISLLVTFCACDQDVNEPNNELGDASEITFDQYVSGNIYPAREGDFYKFYANSPGILRVRLTDVPQDMRARIDFYGKNFNWITRADASDAGDAITLGFDIVEPQMYYLGIVDLDGKAHNESYSLRATFKPVVDQNEPNGEIGDATNVDFDQVVNGYVYPTNDGDFYKFYTETPGNVKVNLESVPDEMRARIDFYGRNFNWITRTDASNSGDVITLEREIAIPGWNYIGIVDLEKKAHDETYSFQVSFKPIVDLNEPNNELADAREINLSQSVSSYIYPSGETDLYKFQLNEPGILVVKMENVPEDMRTRMDFYGKNFNWITRKDASNPGDSITLERDIGNPQWYYLGILDLEGKGHENEYSFQASFEEVVDSNEANNQIGDATEVAFGQATSGYIFPGGDVDFYKFYVGNPGSIKVKLDAIPEEMRGRIDIYGKNFNWITRKDATFAGDAITLNYDVINPGWYYLGIMGLEGKAHNEEYSFTLTSEFASVVDETNGETKDVSENDGQASSSASSDSKSPSTSTLPGASYPEAVLTHEGFDFSQGDKGTYPTYDGEIIYWQSGAATHPDYAREEYLWWRNTHLDDVNFASQTKDMGAVDIATVREVPAEWDKSPLIPPLLVGHTIVAKCYDGYVKFQVISIDLTAESATVKYWYSSGTTFSDPM